MFPFGGTVGDLFGRCERGPAGRRPSTPVGDPNRVLQTELNTFVTAINNGAIVIRDKPCPYNFIN